MTNTCVGRELYISSRSRNGVLAAFPDNQFESRGPTSFLSIAFGPLHPSIPTHGMLHVLAEPAFFDIHYVSFLK